MAKVQVKIPEDFLLKLSKLGDKTDEIIPKVLESGGEIVLEKVRSNLQAVVGSGTKEKVGLQVSLLVRWVSLLLKWTEMAIST